MDPLNHHQLYGSLRNGTIQGFIEESSSLMDTENSSWVGPEYIVIWSLQDTGPRDKTMWSPGYHLDIQTSILGYRAFQFWRDFNLTAYIPLTTGRLFFCKWLYISLLVSIDIMPWAPKANCNDECLKWKKFHIYCKMVSKHKNFHIQSYLSLLLLHNI